MAIDLDLAGIAMVRHSKRSVFELWDRQDAREALRVAGYPMVKQLRIAGNLTTYESISVIDSQQVWAAIAYLEKVTGN